MVWIASSWKPFPRICILVSLHYFPLRQTDRWETLWLWNAPASHFHIPGTHVGSSGRGRRESWYGGKLNIAFGSMEGNCNHHDQCFRPYHHLVSRGEGETQGSCQDHPIRYRVQVTLAGGDRQSQHGGGQQAQGGGIPYWSGRVETLGQDVSEKI